MARAKIKSILGLKLGAGLRLWYSRVRNILGLGLKISQEQSQVSQDTSIPGSMMYSQSTSLGTFRDGPSIQGCVLGKDVSVRHSSTSCSLCRSLLSQPNQILLLSFPAHTFLACISFVNAVQSSHALHLLHVHCLTFNVCCLGGGVFVSHLVVAVQSMPAPCFSTLIQMLFSAFASAGLASNAVCLIIRFLTLHSVVWLFCVGSSSFKHRNQNVNSTLGTEHEPPYSIVVNAYAISFPSSPHPPPLQIHTTGSHIGGEVWRRTPTGTRQVHDKMLYIYIYLIIFNPDNLHDFLKGSIPLKKYIYIIILLLLLLLLPSHGVIFLKVS